METLQNTFVLVHVSAGFIGLVSFWVPVFTRKGGKNHRFYGKIFKYCAYIVLAAAAIALLLRIPELISTNFDNENEVLVLSFYVFLAYLILVVFIGLRHGIAVLAHKKDITELNTGLNHAFANLSIAASLILIVYALIVAPLNQILLYVLSPIGFINGLDIKTAITNRRNFKNTWLYEHLGALLGTGIAFHTALIGVPAVLIWTRIYKQRFGELNRKAGLNES